MRSRRRCRGRRERRTQPRRRWALLIHRSASGRSCACATSAGSANGAPSLVSHPPPAGSALGSLLSSRREQDVVYSLNRGGPGTGGRGAGPQPAGAAVRDSCCGGDESEAPSRLSEVGENGAAVPSGVALATAWPSGWLAPGRWPPSAPSPPRWSASAPPLRTPPWPASCASSRRSRSARGQPALGRADGQDPRAGGHRHVGQDGIAPGGRGRDPGPGHAAAAADLAVPHAAPGFARPA